MSSIQTEGPPPPQLTTRPRQTPPSTQSQSSIGRLRPRRGRHQDVSMMPDKILRSLNYKVKPELTDHMRNTWSSVLLWKRPRDKPLGNLVGGAFRAQAYMMEASSSHVPWTLPQSLTETGLWSLDIFYVFGLRLIRIRIDAYNVYACIENSKWEIVVVTQNISFKLKIRNE